MQYTVKKPINNNILRVVDPTGCELIVTGRGLGFGVKPGYKIEAETVERSYRTVSYTHLLQNRSPIQYERGKRVQNRFLLVEKGSLWQDEYMTGEQCCPKALRGLFAFRHLFGREKPSSSKTTACSAAASP